ncbi:rod shape-determining protein MreC [Clostridium sp. Cult3]|uniref:rod shape-determining protein MreC n=1 Tax=Clostridium sp. Cult3 TaxID=2079004 RepID=UPI001F027128|nr:rod shape-determining protein MreC [Clostridium sp. Cult3]MCF6460591.1 rod shape-determining protein MreC [Clostridium sp. Cult3]
MFFLRKYKNRMIVTIVAIILIIIIGITSTERMSLTKIEKVFGNIFAPVEKFFYNIGKKTSDFFMSIKNIGNLKEENEELKIKIVELEEQNRSYEDLIGKSEYLKNEAELMKNTRYKLISAQIIGKEPGNWFDRFMIDKGLKDGIKKGDTVIQAVETDGNIVQEGIVGRVIEVGDNWAKVISIIDENSKISFKVIRTQDGGVISGSVDGKLSGYLFDTKADVMKGDKLFTSGLGGIFVKDLYIGEIKDVVKKDEDLMKNIYIEPSVDFKKLYKVFIISD